MDTRVSRALHSPDRFLFTNLGLIMVNHGLIMVNDMKEQNKLQWIPKKSTLSRQVKKSYGGQRSDLGHFFQLKNEKIAFRSQYRPIRILILGLYKVISSDHTRNKFPHAWPLWNGTNGKIFLRFWSLLSQCS